MADPAARSGAEAAEKLALTLAGSLILHFVLIFGLQIRAAPAASPSARIIQARLVDPPHHVTALSTTPTPAPEPDALSLQTVDAAPPPKPTASELATPEPAPPASVAPENSANLPSIAVPLIEDPTYYPAQDVDVHPTALQVIQPAYPDMAASSNVAGSVVLLLLLDESGMVQELSVEEANPPGMFEQSALDAFRDTRFSPAQRHGRTVKSRMRIKVTYELTDKKTPVDKMKPK